MKKILSILLAAMMLQSVCINTYAKDTEAQTVQEAYEPTEKAKEAQALLRGLGETEFFETIDNDPVSRGDFIYGLMDVLGISVPVSDSTGFVDVPANSKYAQAVTTALSFRFISEGDNFRVNDSIKLNEAIKIVVGVLGYASIAEINGGYPQGYISIASERDLFKNIEVKEEVTKEDMALLLYNMFMSKVANVDYIGSKPAYRVGEDTLLEALHEVHSIEGVITKNSVTSYDLSYSYAKGNSMVEVDGEAYDSKIDIDKYFGMNCIVYYDDDGIVSVYPKKNNEMTILSKDIIDINDSRLIYEEDGSHREKKVKIDRNYLEVYNGMTTKADEDHILNSSGKVRLVDNNNDNVYDVIFIEHYTYVKVRNVDTTDKLIEDKHSADNNISINEDNIKLSICDIDGATVKPADIKSGDVLQVKKSLDKSFVEIIILPSAAIGRVTSVKEDEEIIINDETYELSDYARSYCDSVNRPGKSISYYVGFNNEIAYVESASEEFVYGYLVRVFYKDEDEESVVMRVFTESGNFNDYEFAKKLKYDGETKKFSAAYDLIKSNFKEQLIKYKLDSDGFVVAIDTAKTVNMETVSTEELMKEKDENNSLTKHEWEEKEYIYRSNGTFGMNFNASSAIVFLLPVVAGTESVVDVSAKEEFETTTVSILNSGSKYSYFEVYDVDEYGCANVLLAYNVARTGSPYSFYSNMGNNYSYGMISKIVDSVSDDGEYGKTITVFSSGKFKEYFLPEDVKYLMPADDSLDKGDIVRFRAVGTRINDIILDFNADRYSHNRDYDKRSAPMGYNYSDAILAYQCGKVYNYGDITCYYTSTVNELTGKYDFSAANLLNSNINTTNICRFDTKSKTVRSIDKNDIRSYVTHGEDADIIVLKQRTANTQCIFVYGKGEE